MKLNRAAYHIQSLNNAVSRWQNTDPFTRNGQANADNSAYIYTFEFNAIPGGIGVIVGDILHNLRSALDNLVWELALRTTENPYDRTSFPIFPSDSDGALKEMERILQDVPKDARDIIIYSLQPYTATNPTTHGLWILHELSNYDKHRVITLSGERLRFDMRAGMEENWLNDYTVKITVPMLDKNLPPPPPEVHCDCLVITDKSGALFRIDVIEAIYKLIRDDVFPRFERFFP